MRTFRVSWSTPDKFRNKKIQKLYEECSSCISLDWKEITGDAVEEFDRALSHVGLEIINFDDGSDMWLLGVHKKTSKRKTANRRTKNESK